MKNIIYLLAKFGVHIAFVILQVIGFALVVNYNDNQRSIFDHTSNVLTNNLNAKVDQLQGFVRLEQINDSLQIENAALISRFVNTQNLNYGGTDSLQFDSMTYRVIPTSICNATTRLKNNYLTLCSGFSDGIKNEMGIITNKGLVGQVIRVSEHYAVVMNLLHTQSRVSAAIKRNNAFGTLRWHGEDTRTMHLESIPKHIEVFVGDTIVTSGYSTIFPKGLPIGIITYAKAVSNDYEIKVSLFNDPSAWDVVYAIENVYAEEKKELEQVADL